jgi:ubiquinone biosynthesis protein
MFDPSVIESYVQGLSPEQLRTALFNFLPQSGTLDERISAVESLLRSTTGRALREQMGRWIVEKLVPVESLVPDEYAQWREPVRESMLFVVSRLSEPRLAPKLVEQLDLPVNTPAEERLLRLISKVPGLQKLGQVLARNRHLRPSMRDALCELENGIHDVTAKDMCALIRRELGERIKKFEVEIECAILSEASVSAVVPFTWRDPVTGQREQGVFKVLKPHIPSCFAEDMEFLHQLAHHFSTKHRTYGFAPKVLTDTFSKVRRHLRHEVNFSREQRMLRKAHAAYSSRSGMSVPRVVPSLCTRIVTAMSRHHGAKVTDTVANMSARQRRHVSEVLIKALVAMPLFSTAEDAIFHADPHAGNLLYDVRTGELTLLDWALAEHLNREQRRHLAVLFAMVGVRNEAGVFRAIEALAERGIKPESRRARMVRTQIISFFNEMPIMHVPSSVDAMKLLERLAINGLRFPASLIMLSKVLFTLDGILEDIGAEDVSLGLTMGRELLKKWLTDRSAVGAPLTAKDWVAVQCGVAVLTGRMLVDWEEKLLGRFYA